MKKTVLHRQKKIDNKIKNVKSHLWKVLEIVEKIASLVVAVHIFVK